MATRIPLFNASGTLFGHFTTHLDPQDVAMNIEADGADFVDWSGTFLPTAPETWHEDHSLILCIAGTPWYQLVDQIGRLEEVAEAE
jgi:hypothetical protein